MGIKVYEIDFLTHKSEREKIENNLPPGITVHYYLQGNGETLSGFFKGKSWAKLFNHAQLCGYLKINIVFTDREIF